MFDLSFTQDPEWIAQRQDYWRELEKQLSDGYTKREVKQWMSYAKTGVIPSGLKIAPCARMELFPVFNRESVAYCLRELVSENLSEREYFSIQNFFYIGINRLPDLSYADKVDWFTHVFGDAYDPERKFPFLIGNEQSCRTITVPSSHIFSVCLNQLRVWLSNVDEPKPIGFDLLDFIFSLLPHLDVRIFRAGEKDGRGESLPFQGRTKLIQAKLYLMFEYCLQYPEVTADPELGVERRELAKNFVARLEALESWPEGLRELWESAKQEFAHGN